ncbi:MAG: sugar transferase [Eubacterium sp.]|nr:sugar transferase [Eubacterium sp.]
MNKKKGIRAKHLDFIVLDIIACIISLILSFIIRFGSIFEINKHGDYRVICVGVILVYVFLMLFNNYHSGILKRGPFNELGHSIFLNAEIVIFIVVFLFAFKVSAVYSRLFIGYFFVSNVILIFLFRVLRKAAIVRGYKKGKNVRNTIVVIHVDEIHNFIDSMNENNTGYYKLTGIMLLGGNEDSRHAAKMALVDTGVDIPVIKKGELLEFVKNNVINEAFIVGRLMETEKITDLLLNMGITINMEISGSIGGLNNAKIAKFGDYTMLTSSISSGTVGEFVVKRIFDIIVSLVGLVFTGIFYVILAPIIKKQSPGPVFFSQDRVGKNGETFKIYKFRSMYMDAEERKKELMAQNEMQGLMFKMENDPRIFPLGHFIRKTSLDEFPQFWNILKGDMSFVGTRPPTLDEYKEYAPHHLSRLAIKPGLTGMWQVSGRSDIKDFEEVVELDNEYIRNFSLLLDVKIILKTFGAVLGKKGSA